MFHQRILHIHRWRIHFSICTDGQPRSPTVNCLYYRCRRYRWTRFSRATSCPWNNADYLFHQRILHIHQWRIHFSIGTDGQPRSPTVDCLYHWHRWYRWTRFSRATSCPWNNADYLFHQRILHIHQWCIHFSIGTDGQPRFTVGTDGQGFRGLHHALGITLTTCLIHQSNRRYACYSIGQPSTVTTTVQYWYLNATNHSCLRMTPIAQSQTKISPPPKEEKQRNKRNLTP